MVTAIHKEQGLLFVAGDAQVAVWGLQNGIVGTRSGSTLDYDPTVWKQKTKYMASIEPMAVYENKKPRLLTCDQSTKTTRFFVQGSDDFTCDVYSASACMPGKLALENTNPGALLLVPGAEEVAVSVMHDDKVNCMTVSVTEEKKKTITEKVGSFPCTAKEQEVIQPERNDPYLITACDDGQIFMWDLEGADKGQIVQEMRSLQTFEMLFPPILMIVGMLQINSFAFTSPIPWPEPLHSFMYALHKIVLWDFAWLLSSGAKMGATKFWEEMVVVAFTIATFVIFALAGVPQKLDGQVRDSLSYARGKTKDGQPREKTGFGPLRLKAKLTRLLRNIVYLFMELTSTVFVAPICMKVAQATGCYRPFGTPWTDYLGNPNHRIRLSAVPEIKCMEGPHMILFIFLLIFFIPFVMTLIPFATCSGDARYVPTQAIWLSKGIKKTWHAAAHRKASSLHMGWLHLYPENAFVTLLSDLLAKVILPFIACQNTTRPIVQMVLLWAACVGIHVQALIWAPYIDRKFCCLVQDLKLFNAYTAFCGLIAAFGNNRKSLTSTVFWIIFMIVVLVLLVTQMLVIKRGHLKVRKLVPEKSSSDRKTVERPNDRLGVSMTDAKD